MMMSGKSPEEMYILTGINQIHETCNGGDSLFFLQLIDKSKGEELKIFGGRASKWGINRFFLGFQSYMGLKRLFI